MLNKAIADELRAVHQYMYFDFHCDDKELDNLTKFGSNYLALQSIERSKSIAAGRQTE